MSLLPGTMDTRSSYVLVVGQDSGIGRVGTRFVEVQSTKGLEKIMGKSVGVRVCTECDHVALCFSMYNDSFVPVDPNSVLADTLRELVNPFNVLEGETWGTDVADVTRCTVVGAFTVWTLRAFGVCCQACDKCG